MDRYRQHQQSPDYTQRRSHEPSLIDAANPPRENPPNVLLDYTNFRPNDFIVVRFIFECGAKLGAQPMTVSTAAFLLHKFRTASSKENHYDIFLIASACLYLAGKIESQLLKIRDVINVARVTLHRNSTPLDLGEAYWAARDSIVQTELLLIRILSFDLTIQHPQKFLVHYLRTLENITGGEEWTKIPVARTSWAIVQDFHHDRDILTYPPQAIAIAAIELALSAFGCTVPLCATEGRSSWQSIFYSDFNLSQNAELMKKMLNLYDHEFNVLRESLFPVNPKESK